MINTPIIPPWIRDFSYPGYTNSFSFLPNCTRLYATETLFGDWGAKVLLLAKDAAPTRVIKSLAIKEGAAAWRHAQRKLGDEAGWKTNERLDKLAVRINASKLYGSATANMLYNNPNWSRNLPGFKHGELNEYLAKVLNWVIDSMPNLRVIACLGKESWYLTCNVLGASQEAKHWADFLKSGEYITGNVGGRLIIATSHYHPAARVSTTDIERNWDTIGKLLGNTSQKKN